MQVEKADRKVDSSSCYQKNYIPELKTAASSVCVDWEGIRGSPIQTPAEQVSLVVVALLSLHMVPSGTNG